MPGDIRWAFKLPPDIAEKASEGDPHAKAFQNVLAGILSTLIERYGEDVVVGGFDLKS